MSGPPLLFDRRLHRRRLDRAATGYGVADFLKQRAADDAVDRLEAILRSFRIAVDLGARSGAFKRALASSSASERVEHVIEADLSGRMLGGRSGLRVQADEERLPFADASLDLVVSTLSLHWTNDLPGALAQIRRALKPDGLFIGSLLGGQTLRELRWALTQAEIEVRGGAGPRVSPFADALHGAGLLQRAGFALPVSDVDRVTVRYSHPLKLLADLRAMGETSVLVERPGFLSRTVLERAFALYMERYGEPDGKAPATFDIINLTGWSPHESQPKALKPGSAKMRLADAISARSAPSAS